jgi:HSP20 family molecular chaperone IbpA
MYKDDMDDLFDILDKMFPNDNVRRNKSIHLDYNSSERIVDEENNKIYYTLKLKNVDDIGDIKVNVDSDRLEVEVEDNLIPDDGEIIPIVTPKPLIPNKSDYTYNNDLLDITVYIDEEAENEERKEIN